MHCAAWTRKINVCVSSRDGALRKRERGDEVRAGAQGRARMSVGDQSTPSLGFADVSWRCSATGMTQGLM